MLISLLPLLGTLIYLIYAYKYDTAFLAILVATFPRQIQMIQNMDVVTQLISEWTDIKERLTGLKNALIVPVGDPQERIKWDKLNFYQSSRPFSISSIDALYNFLTTPNRITIRGENGVGKSTLLKHLKDKTGGYYLPAKPTLSFECPNWQTLSTGEQILVALKEACSNNNFEKLILLDEWDANLDLANREKISRIIDELSQKRTIVEVVHRQDDIILNLNQAS
jgi:ABC-type bacteriocin/lantibiotic exporter with double-glycine peptidase domain